MTFCIISHIEHTKFEDNYFSYSPYIKEMNIWLKYVDKVIVVAPLENYKINPIHEFYKHSNIEFVEINRFDLLKFSSILKSFFKIPLIFFKVYIAMKEADHIHLRCPGNIGLIGCLVQILFPRKIKTAKYAGNWDPNAKQPLSYNIQKWILNNTFLTKKIQVLVYGAWQNSSKNIKPFFTASYKESDKEIINPRDLVGKIKFMFVGTLSSGKRPLYAIKLIEKLKKLDCNVQLSIFGEGIERKNLEDYIETNKLNDFIFLKGNQNQEKIKIAYQENHFVVLSSKSEGWPKVIAEGMFWACLPIASKVSCVPNMLDEGNRGLLLEMNFNEDVKSIQNQMNDFYSYNRKAINAMNWSRKYTLNVFENEIKTLLKR